MEQEFKNAKGLIEKSNRILLTMHERMDGDDGGSILAMHRQLENMGKTVTSAIKQGVPPTLQFLPGSQKIQDDIEHEEFDLLITFGCSDLDRCGSQKITKLTIPIINIDHHPDNTNFGHINLVDAGKSSVAELTYDFFIYSSWPINKEAATCLLTGIITDTGSFMHSNTKESTLKVAADLVSKGAQVSKIARQTSKNKNPTVLKAWGKAMENSFYDSQNKIIYSVMTEKDLKEIGQLPPAAFEGFAETLNTVPEAKFAMFLRQEGNIIKGSLRSDKFKNADVSKIAKLFGGGGHKLAAGFSVIGRLMKDEKGKWKVI
jgi:phosphoesterase RecJ-like protein